MIKPKSTFNLRASLIIGFLFLAFTPALLLALTGNSLLAAILHLLLSLTVGIYILRRLIAPINQLIQIAERISIGDLWIQASGSDDELGFLARALNAMTVELRRTITNMERSIAERTAELTRVHEQTKKRASQLQTIAEVAQTITTVQDPDILLAQVTEFIGERFGFYHVGVFLVDKTGDWAILQAANSEGGRRMLARGYRLRIEQAGMVGEAIRRGEPRLALDTGAEAIYLDNPDLPYTLSELVLPLKIGEKVIGALDVHSMERLAFREEDISLLSTLANQVAIAIQNAHLFLETRNALVELQTLHRQYLREAWASYSAQNIKGYVYHQGKISPLIQVDAPKVSQEIWEALEENQMMQVFPPADQGSQEESSEKPSLIVPITIRGQVIGMLNLIASTAERDSQERPLSNKHVWTEEEINLVKMVADQVGLAIENARLLEETQRRAEREHLVAEITSKLRASNQSQEILKTAVNELRQALRASRVQLTFPSEKHAESLTDPLPSFVLSEGNDGNQAMETTELNELPKKQDRALE